MQHQRAPGNPPRDLTYEDIINLLFYMKAASSITSKNYLHQFLDKHVADRLWSSIERVKQLAREPLLVQIEDELKGDEKNKIHGSLYGGPFSLMNHYNFSSEEEVEKNKETITNIALRINQLKSVTPYFNNCIQGILALSSVEKSVEIKLKAAMVTLSLIDAAPFIKRLKGVPVLQNALQDAIKNTPRSKTRATYVDENLFRLVTQLIPIEGAENISFPALFNKLIVPTNAPCLEYMFSEKNNILATVTVPAQYLERIATIREKELASLKIEDIQQSCNLEIADSKLNEYITEQLSSIPDPKAKKLMSEIIATCKKIYQEKKTNQETLDKYVLQTTELVRHINTECKDISLQKKTQAACDRICLGLHLAIATVTSEEINDKIIQPLIASSLLRHTVATPCVAKGAGLFGVGKENKEPGIASQGKPKKRRQSKPPILI